MATSPRAAHAAIAAGVSPTLDVVEPFLGLPQPEEERFRTAFARSLTGMAVIGLDDRFLHVNAAYRRMVGLPDVDLVGEHWSSVAAPEHRDAGRAYWRSALAGRRTSLRLERPIRADDGSEGRAALIRTLVRGTDGAPRHFLEELHDITARSRLEQELAHRVGHDIVTGLPNRSMLMERLESVLVEPRTTVTVLCANLGRLRLLNGTLGHRAGDELLRGAAERLRHLVRPQDAVARFDGDEFVVVCEGLAGEGEVAAIAERLSAALEEPFTVLGEEVYVSASVGVATTQLPEGSDGTPSPQALIRQADEAMAEAKARGDGHRLYRDEIHSRAEHRLRTGNELHRALERGELRIHYQPEVALGTGRILGVEALVRWQHPRRGLLTPAEFIPLAEETGLIVPIGRWVLEEALREVAGWNGRLTDRPPLRVSVNLAPQQIDRPDVVDDVRAALDGAGVDPSLLNLEMTESVLMEPESVRRTLQSLKDLGVQLTIDDFGTGYSSLTYLKRFPVDSLKVDRSFVDGLGTDSEDTAIVSAVLGLGQALGLSVVAEGVETPEQVRALRRLRCAFGQGYFFAPPRPPRELFDLLRHDPRW